MITQPSTTPKRSSYVAAVSIAGAMALALVSSKGIAASTSTEDQSTMLNRVALAIAAYKDSADRCYYDQKDKSILEGADAFLTRRLPDIWPQFRDTAPDTLPALKNNARIMGSRSDCITLGNAVGLGLITAFYTGQLDATVGAEMDRLLKGGGRGKTEPAPAGPPAPQQQTAADSVAAWNAAKKEDDAKAERSRAALAAEPPYPGYAAQGSATPQSRATPRPDPRPPIGDQRATSTPPQPSDLASALSPPAQQRPADGVRTTASAGANDPTGEPTAPAFSPARAAVSDCLKDVDLMHDKN